MAFYEACRFFVVCIFLKLLTVFVGRHRSFSLYLLVVFSLFLSAVSEASRFFVGCLFTVVIGRLKSFLLFLSAVLEASRCFCQPFRKFLSAVLEASVCRSCCFVVGRFLAALASCSCFFGSSYRCFRSLFFSFYFSKNFFCLSFSNWSTR